jgi:hypothetical protein
MKRPKPLDPSALRTISLSERSSKVTIQQSFVPFGPNSSVADFVGSLPHVLAASDLRDLARRVVRARRDGKQILVMCGGHVVKTGLAPLLIDMIKQGFATALAVNGAVAIHDVEIALAGRTSEDVGPALKKGMFGVARETADVVNEGASWAWNCGKGLGEGIGQCLATADPPYAASSLILQAHLAGIPITVHVAIGTDVVHQHSSASGEAIGASSLTDFRLLAAVVARLDAGVVVNIGSAVVLPEVFLKALNLARNLGHHVERFTAADFDFIRHYRPENNVVRRPTGEKGKGFLFTGHHELLVPLLYAAVLAAAEEQSE